MGGLASNPVSPVAGIAHGNSACSNSPNASSEDIIQGPVLIPAEQDEPSELKARMVPYYAFRTTPSSSKINDEPETVMSSRLDTGYEAAGRTESESMVPFPESSGLPRAIASSSTVTSTKSSAKLTTAISTSKHNGNLSPTSALFTVDAIAVSTEPGSATSTSTSTGNIFAGGYQSFVLTFANQASTSLDSDLSTQLKIAVSTKSSPSATPTPSSICPARNDTTYTSVDKHNYQVICNIDYPVDILPFRLVDSFEDCLAACDAFNTENSGSTRCLAALFVPGRVNNADDCYLKPSIDHPTAATVGIEGAILVTQAAPTTSTESSSKSSSAVVTSTNAPGSEPGITYASGNKVITPKPSGSSLHGPTLNKPTNQFINITAPKIDELASDLLVPGVNTDLSTNYPISENTGVLHINISTQSYLDTLSNTPHISRDGGRGGQLNGQHLFIFCDTGSYSTTTSTEQGDFLGFVSSSVAVDTGMHALSGNPINLKDGIGQWSDEAGRMRGLAPLTTGELQYNLAMQGDGQRYAVWPEASIIPLDATNALVYAPIIYDEVNMDTREAKFTYTGATLLEISVGGKSGPVAKRVKDVLFERDEVEWGCAGGIRSWGPSGIGGDDGSVYVFGAVNHGILLARTSPHTTADRDSVSTPGWSGYPR